MDGPNYEICSDFIDVVVDMNDLYGFVFGVNDTDSIAMASEKL